MHRIALQHCIACWWVVIPAQSKPYTASAVMSSPTQVRFPARNIHNRLDAAFRPSQCGSSKGKLPSPTGRAMKKTLWLLTIALFSCFSYAQRDTVIVRPQPIDDVLQNPGMGITTFNRFNGQATNPPHTNHSQTAAGSYRRGLRACSKLFVYSNPMTFIRR